jgi:hypothetical protein
MAKYSRLAAALCDMDLKDYDFDSPYDQYPIDKALKEKYGIENIDILRILVKNLLSCIKITRHLLKHSGPVYWAV